MGSFNRSASLYLGISHYSPCIGTQERSLPNHCNGRRHPTRAKATPKTLTTPSSIAREIRTAAKQCYAISDEELEPGMRSLAVPVHGAGRAVIAAMSVSAFVARVSVDDLVGESPETLKKSAEELERKLKAG